jgi:hypothetical protein
MLSGCASTNSHLIPEADKNKKPSFTTEGSDWQPRRFGSGTCKTEISSIAHIGDRLYVNMPKPERCAFSSVRLRIGEDTFSPIDLKTSGFTFNSLHSHYVWTGQSATFIFKIQRNLALSDLDGEFGLQEPNCKSNSCLTDGRLIEYANLREAKLRQARQIKDREDLKLAAEKLQTPNEILAFLANNSSKLETDSLALLNRRVVLFEQKEADFLAAATFSELKEFLKTRSETANDPELAASEKGKQTAVQLLGEKWRAAIPNQSTEELKNNLTDPLAPNEIQNLSVERLKTIYIQTRNFSGMYQIFKIDSKVETLKQASQFASTIDDFRSLETASVKLLKVPARQFVVSADFSSASVSSNVKQNMGVFANFTANVFREFKGKVVVTQAEKPPIPLKYGRYAVWLNLDLVMSREEQMRSRVLRSYTKSNDVRKSTLVRVELDPISFSGSSEFSFGAIESGYFQSGSAGGFTAIFPTSDPVLQISISSINELSK